LLQNQTYYNHIYHELGIEEKDVAVVERWSVYFGRNDWIAMFGPGWDAEDEVLDVFAMI